jgi:hypothetical protein
MLAQEGCCSIIHTFWTISEMKTHTTRTVYHFPQESVFKELYIKFLIQRNEQHLAYSTVDDISEICTLDCDKSAAFINEKVMSVIDKHYFANAPTSYRSLANNFKDRLLTNVFSVLEAIANYNESYVRSRTIHNSDTDAKSNKYSDRSKWWQSCYRHLLVFIAVPTIVSLYKNRWSYSCEIVYLTYFLMPGSNNRIDSTFFITRSLSNSSVSMMTLSVYG